MASHRPISEQHGVGVAGVLITIEVAFINCEEFGSNVRGHS